MKLHKKVILQDLHDKTIDCCMSKASKCLAFSETQGIHSSMKQMMALVASDIDGGKNRLKL